MVEHADLLDRTSDALSEDERRCWLERGVVGPFRAWTADEAEELRQRSMRGFQSHSVAFGFHTVRDRHLDCRAVFELGTHPAILDRAAALYGPDLVLWRSNLFHKPPGAGEIAYHQGRDFPGLVRDVPALVPGVSLSAWVALTRSSRENGCVKFLPGTHTAWHEPEVVEDGRGIFGRNVALTQFDDAEPYYMELEPGEFVLFSESLVHGSDANESDSDRTGVVFRFTPTSTRIYEGLRVDGKGMPLSGWHGILVRGEDRHGRARLGAPPERDVVPVGRVRRLAGRLRRRWYHHVHGLP